MSMTCFGSSDYSTWAISGKLRNVEMTLRTV